MDFINEIHEKLFWIIKNYHLPFKSNRTKYHLKRWNLRKKKIISYLLRSPRDLCDKSKLSELVATTLSTKRSENEDGVEGREEL